MKAAVIEPSARRRRKRLGAMFAVVKADITSPAPNIASCTESRRSPSTRETSVRNEMTPMFLRLFDTRSGPGLRRPQVERAALERDGRELRPRRREVLRHGLGEEELAQ